MGDYADDAMDRDFDNMANSMFHDDDSDDDDVDFRHPAFNNDCPYVKKFSETTVSFIDIKQTTPKAILIKLGYKWKDREGKPRESKYVWLPVEKVEIDEKNHKITVPNWLLSKKIQEIRTLLQKEIEKENGDPKQTKLQF